MPAKKKAARKPREELRAALEKRSDGIRGAAAGARGGPRAPGLGMSWVPDMRDFGFDLLRARKKSVRPHVARLKESLDNAPERIQALKADGDEPEGWNYDNIGYCAPVEDQEDLGSCTAQSVVGMMEYMMIRAGIRHFDLSRLFLATDIWTILKQEWIDSSRFRE